MAATITSIGNGTGATTPNTGATVTGTVANGDWFVVIITTVGHATDPPFASVTDTAGNTYTARVNFDSGDVSGSGAALSIFTAPVTSDITNGTVTGHRSYTATYSSIIQVYRVRPSAGGVISFVAANDPGSSGSATRP